MKPFFEGKVLDIAHRGASSIAPENTKESFLEAIKAGADVITEIENILAKELNEKEFIVKYDIGHQKVDYEITNKGKKMFKVLLQLTELAK